MVEKIMREIENRLANCKNQHFPYADLIMKNGDEVSIEAPSKYYTGSDYYSITTDDNKIIRYKTLNEVATWIHENYKKQ